MNHPSDEVYAKMSVLDDEASEKVGEYYAVLAKQALATAVSWIEAGNPTYAEYNLGALLKAAAEEVCHRACLLANEAPQLLELAVDLVTSHLDPYMKTSVKYADLTHVASAKVNLLILRGALLT